MNLKRVAASLLAVCTVAVSLSIGAEAIREIKEASDEVRKELSTSGTSGQPTSASSAVNAAGVARLEAALKRGEEINSALQGQVESLKTERAQLVQVQTTLASGLIGALVTAIVAIGGAILSSKASKPDRDLKRLAVIEKARELKQAGVSLPADIETTYVRNDAPAG